MDPLHPLKCKLFCKTYTSTSSESFPTYRPLTKGAWIPYFIACVHRYPASRCWRYNMDLMTHAHLAAGNPCTLLPAPPQQLQILSATCSSAHVPLSAPAPASPGSSSSACVLLMLSKKALLPRFQTLERFSSFKNHESWTISLTWCNFSSPVCSKLRSNSRTASKELYFY